MKVPSPKKLKSGTWFIQLRLGGESIYVTASTERECRRQAELIKAEHRSGKKPSSSSLTLDAALQRYIRARENVLSPSTVRGYEFIRANRFKAYAQVPLRNINFQRMINDEAALCSPRTLKNSWTLVKAAVKAAGMDVTDPTLPALIPYEKKWITPENIPAFLAAIKNRPGELGMLLALSGLRRSEIYGLTWDDVDLKAKEIHVRRSMVLDADAEPVLRQQNKNYSSTRIVPIFLDRLYDVLCAVEDRQGQVLTGPVTRLRQQVTAACKRAGIDDVGVHGLRHSFASLCYHLGLPELTTMQLGGWSDYQTMRRIYTHLSEKDKAAGVDKLSTFFKQNAT